MDFKDSLFAEKFENHINFLEICLNVFDIKPVEDKNLTQRLIQTNSKYLKLEIKKESPKSSPQIQQPTKLKNNDDDDDEEEEY